MMWKLAALLLPLWAFWAGMLWQNKELHREILVTSHMDDSIKRMAERPVEKGFEWCENVWDTQNNGVVVRVCKSNP